METIDLLYHLPPKGQVCVCDCYPMPDSSLKKRKKPQLWANEDRKAKTQFIANATVRQRRRPTLSARPPHRNAPTIMLTKTIRPAQRNRDYLWVLILIIKLLDISLVKKICNLWLNKVKRRGKRFFPSLHISCMLIAIGLMIMKGVCSSSGWT